ncbi:hypothetical protein MalM25_02070 [Planctomycetes bacterium MalM25]|nr:hypothetical protein MalM25_02070 [Planctomycetes bacterium MalM25]
MIVTILLGVVTLAVLALAFLASKFWHWAHVLVLVLFYFASTGYAILAAKTLDNRLGHQEQIAKAEVELEQQRLLNEALTRGTEDRSVISKLAARDVLAAQGDDGMKGVVRLTHELRLKSRVRGRVWRFAGPAGPVNPETGAVTVNFPVQQAQPTEEEADAEPTEAPQGPPPALGLTADSIIYLFEQGPVEGFEQDPAPNAYLGEFRVDEVQGRQASLEPLDQLELDAAGAERLLQSRGPWIVYETMPADNRDLFAGLEEETLRRLLPDSSVEEYLRDGTPAQGDDDPNRLVDVDTDGKLVSPDDPDNKAVGQQYRRRLRDYTYLLNDYERERAELYARQQAVTEDLAKLADALENAKKVEAYRQEELGKWQDDLAAVDRDREAIERHAQALQSQVELATRLLDDTLRQNAQLASARLERRGRLVPFESGGVDIDAL